MQGIQRGRSRLTSPINEPTTFLWHLGEPIRIAIITIKSKILSNKKNH